MGWAWVLCGSLRVMTLYGIHFFKGKKRELDEEMLLGF